MYARFATAPGGTGWPADPRPDLERPLSLSPGPPPLTRVTVTRHVRRGGRRKAGVTDRSTPHTPGSPPSSVRPPAGFLPRPSQQSHL
eukprot:362279-Chlamydomonas_euryale.AAC.4